MANRLDIIAVQVEDERAVIVGIIVPDEIAFRTSPRSPRNRSRVLGAAEQKTHLSRTGARSPIHELLCDAFKPSIRSWYLRASLRFNGTAITNKIRQAASSK
jgi:hypothetical protein